MSGAYVRFPFLPGKSLDLILPAIIKHLRKCLCHFDVHGNVFKIYFCLAGKSGLSPEIPIPEQ